MNPPTNVSLISGKHFQWNWMDLVLSVIQRGILTLHPCLRLAQGLTRHRITDPNGMGVKHDVGLYAMLGHDDFCKMMLMVCVVH
jgi:hypothetical protein